MRIVQSSPPPGFRSQCPILVGSRPILQLRGSESHRMKPRRTDGRDCSTAFRIQRIRSKLAIVSRESAKSMSGFSLARVVSAGPCPAGAGSDPEARRRRDHGQPGRPQRPPDLRPHRNRRRTAAVPAPQSQPQSDRERPRHAKGPAGYVAARSIDQIQDAIARIIQPAHQTSAQTTSPPLDMMQTERKMP